MSANKIYLNVEKTELVIFKSPKKVLLDEIKIKLSWKRLYPSNANCTFVPPYDDSSWKNAAESFTVALSLTLEGYESAIAPISWSKDW